MECPRCHSRNEENSQYCSSCKMSLGNAEPAETTRSLPLETALNILTEGSLVAGKYRIVEEIGRGGMGIIYLAKDLSLGRKVALKFLSEHLSLDSTAHKRLLREAKAAAALDHANICSIHEVSESQGQSFIVMEYVEGQSIKDRLRAGPLPINEAIRIASEVAEALAKAHERGIIHRDLKPANIMLTRRGRPKVMDFGLAKRTAPEGWIEDQQETNTSLTQSGGTVGTLAYISPEQLRGQEADPRSDLWALGMVLYEMVAGERPFRGSTVFELSSAILTAPPAPLPPRVPAELAAVIQRCLDKEPARRYQRSDELRAALEAVRAGAGATVRYRDLGRRLALAVLPLQNLSGDPAQDYFVEGTHEALITDLAKISALRVIARSSSIRFSGSEKSLPEIARELKVDAVLTGSVALAGNRVRITARLIDAATEEHLWAERYERELRDVLSLQNEIVMSIAREIQLQLTPQEQARLKTTRQVDPAAHAAYLKGRFHWYKLSRQELDVAMEYFQLALRNDPNYAPAFVGIADVWMEFGDAGFIPARDATPKAKAAVLRALELDDTLAEAHVTLANFRTLYDWDWPAAEREFRRAIEINSSHANAHFMFSDFLISLRRTEEWEVEARRTLALDPLNFFFQCFYGWHLVYVHRYDAAVAQLHKVLAMQPGFASAHMGLWGAFYRKAMYEEALAQARKFFLVLGDHEVVAALDSGNAEAGYRAAMRCAGDALSARSNRTHVSAVRIARVYAHAGANERALEWLERAYDRRETPLIHIGVGWDWDGLRGDPHFKDLLCLMNLPSD